MSKVFRYTVRDAATLLGNDTFESTKIVPCRGATAVVFRFKSTDATDTLQTVSLEVSNEYSATPLTLSIGAQNYNQRGSVTGTRLNAGDGLALMLVPSDFGMPIKDSFARVVITAVTGGATPANDLSGLEILAEVYYDEDYWAELNQTLTAI